MKRLIGYAIQATLWVVLLAFLLLLAVPHFTAYDVLIVRGGSMEPTIHVGSAVVVDRSTRVLAIGDAAAFNDPTGETVTHRVIAMDGAAYVTRGDANPAPDADHRPSNAVIGRALFSLPYLGYVLFVLQQPWVFLTLLALTGGFIVLSELRTIWAEIRRLAAGRRLAQPPATPSAVVSGASVPAVVVDDRPAPRAVPGPTPLPRPRVGSGKAPRRRSSLSVTQLAALTAFSAVVVVLSRSRSVRQHLERSIPGSRPSHD